MFFYYFANENKALLKKYADVWDRIKKEIKAIYGGKENYYGKNYMKIKFNSDDDLPFNKPLKFDAITIIIRSVSEESGTLYTQVVFRRRFVWVIRTEINIRQMKIKIRPDNLFSENLVVNNKTLTLTY